MAPDRSKAGGNRNRPDVLIDNRAIQRVHLDHHRISSHANVIAEIGKTPGLVPDGAISTAKIANLAVTADKIANTTITAAQLADTAITGGKLANTTITDTQLANDAVTTAKINAGAVTTTELGADAVDGTKIADDAIGSEHIADDAVVAAAIADDAVGSAQIADGAVDTARLGADAVTSAKIADDAVGSEHIADDAVVAAAIADDAVGSAAIADDAVGSAQIADGAVDTARLSDGAVTEVKLNNTHVLRADRQVGNPYATLSTTTITQWYSFTIPGGTLATRNVRVVAHGTLKQNSGSSQNFRAVIRLGGTDIHEAAGSISDDADDAVWRMELELSYRANRAQFISGTWRVSGQYNSSDGISNIFGITKDGIWGNDAVTQNDTGDLALSFHQKWDTSTTSSDFKVYAVAVEYV